VSCIDRVQALYGPLNKAQDDISLCKPYKNNMAKTKKNMRILKTHPILGLVNSYMVDSPQPSNISYL
jgi:ubiquinol-cytochrome c reductase cytochrome b subunit